MRTLPDIRADIDRESDRRAELRRTLSLGHDTAVVAELKSLDERLAALWEEHRITRARLRFGDRDRIITRARAEERLERAA
ncbi:MAG TPA: hypothetical protein VM290_06225 [Gaiellaceae bacterium]|nr:hypothetical protein [Gaiellaceae bacterium]